MFNSQQIKTNSFKSILLLIITAFIFTTTSAQVTFKKNIVATGVSENSGLISADLDNDGDKDIIGNSYSKNQIYWWRNDGGEPIVWTKLIVDNNLKGAHYVYADDIDGDGRMDVLATASVNDAQVVWWHNDGGDSITWTKEIIRENFGNAHGIFAKDINGDGKLDVVATAAFDSLICWWENDGSYPVNWTEHVVDNKSPVSQSVISGDIDNDGDNDIIATSEHKIFLFRNEGGNPVTWTKQTIDSYCKIAHWVNIEDINSDGLLDIVACGFAENNFRWYENDGSENIAWSKHLLPDRCYGSLTVAAADLNNDNRPDLIGTLLSRNEVTWWSNDGGDPVSWTRQVIGTFKYPWALIVEDFDNDGDIDILTGSNTLGQIYLFENQLNPTSIDNSLENNLQGFELKQNYPNPFNPSTNISFTIPNSGDVKLSVYNSIGSKIATIANKFFSAGNHTIEFNGSNVASGIYYYHLETNSYSMSKSMVLLK